MLKQTIHIAYGIDEKYLFPFYVSITSVFSHNSHLKVIIHLVISDISENERADIKNYVKFHKGEIYFYTIEKNDLSELVVPDNTYFTTAIYYRLLIPRLISPIIAKIIYLDSDIIVCGSLMELYQTDLKDLIIGAVSDLQVIEEKAKAKNKDDNYFNSGVLLIDLVMWNKSNVTKDVFDFLKENSTTLKYPDQDALNEVLLKRWYSLDQKFNMMFNQIVQWAPKSISQHLEEVIVLHFNDRFKPWFIHSRHPMKFLFEKYAGIFFNSEAGKNCIFNNLKLETASVIFEIFENETYSVELVILNAFALHYCWINTLSIGFETSKKHAIVNEFYGFNKVTLDRLSLVELELSFEDNKDLLLEIKNSVYETYDTDIEIPAWISVWKRICKSVFLNSFKQYKESGDFNQILIVPQIIDKQLNMPQLTKNYINYFIWRINNSTG